MKPINIMDTLTPKPPFDPAKKNEAVKFGTPKFVNAMKATTVFIKGINRTKN